MKMLRKLTARARRYARDERGSPAVEFALIGSLVFVPLFLGIVQFGTAFYTYNEMMNGARDAARRMAVGESGDVVTPAVLAAMTLHEDEQFELCMEDGETVPACSSDLTEPLPVKSVRATVRIPLSEAMVLGLPKGVSDRTLTASVTMYDERQ